MFWEDYLAPSWVWVRGHMPQNHVATVGLRAKFWIHKLLFRLIPWQGRRRLFSMWARHWTPCCSHGLCRLRETPQKKTYLFWENIWLAEATGLKKVWWSIVFKFCLDFSHLFSSLSFSWWILLKLFYYTIVIIVVGLIFHEVYYLSFYMLLMFLNNLFNCTTLVPTDL